MSFLMLIDNLFICHSTSKLNSSFKAFNKLISSQQNNDENNLCDHYIGD